MKTKNLTLDILKNIIKLSLFLVIGILLGTILMIVVYFIPTGVMKNHVYESIPLFKSEGTYPQIINGYATSQLDNHTDALMLNNAIYDGDENAFLKSMSVFRIDQYDNPVISLIKYFEDSSTSKSEPYPRYWHGYLVVLKPLLVFFNYAEIRNINMCTQIGLIAFLIFLMTKKGYARYTPAFILAFVFIVPVAVMMSLHFSIVFYIFTVAIIVLLLFYRLMKEKNWFPLFFLMLGMATSFFDLLSYPLATLGVPLVLLLVMNEQRILKNKLLLMITVCIYWAIGYVGMWVGKWAIGSLITGQNIFRDAFKTFLFRISNETATGGFSITDVLKANFSIAYKSPFIVLTIITTIVVIFFLVKSKPNYKQLLINSIAFAIIGIMPYVWYAFASNHSYIHAWSTYRVQIITVFAFLSMLIQGIKIEDIN